MLDKTKLNSFTNQFAAEPNETHQVSIFGTESQRFRTHDRTINVHVKLQTARLFSLSNLMCHEGTLNISSQVPLAHGRFDCMEVFGDSYSGKVSIGPITFTDRNMTTLTIV